VVNEAMAAMLPVVVSHRCGCAAELVREGTNGFVVDPYDVERIATAMLNIAGGAHDRRSMGLASRDIVAQWSPERFARNLTAAAKAAMKEPRPRPDIIDRVLLWLLKTR
jgi:glycosyltransferase involved in cell wall biosynthesis